MKRFIFIFLIPFLIFCENDRLPTNPEFSETGTIQIIIENETGTKKNLPDSLSEIQKIAKPSTINQLEVRVLNSANSQVAAKTFTASGGYFEGTITVKAQDNLKVLCIGTNDGIVERFGADENVDVKAGKTTTAAISGWNTSYIPEITDISPNPSTDGSYTVAWSTTPNATAYVLQEAYNQEFSGAVASYFTAGLGIFISGKGVGTCYYRIQSSNEYDIKSGWSVIESAVVQNTHTLSGTVSGADGVTVTLGGDASEIQKINNGESYSFTVAEGGSYTITPSKTGYSFTPPVQTYTNVTSGQTRDFSCVQDFYTISGTVTGADDVIVILGGDASDSKTVDNGDTYSFTVGGGGSYTVTPFKTGYLFNPASSSFTEVTSNRTQNFSGTSSLVTYTLSGTFTGANGVIITLSGDASGSRLVNDGGSYSFTVAGGGNYTVTPTKSGYTFTPASGTFNNVTANKTQNFTAIKITYTISGTISGTDGVTVTLSGDASENQVVNDGGSYSFTVNSGGNYTVTPSKSGYTFTPASGTFNNITTNKTQNFTAIKRTYTISGTISGADGVTVIISGNALGSQTVNDGGSYSFTVNSGGNYTLTPSKSGYTFTPASQTFNNVTSNKTQNFTALPKVVTTEITMVSIPAGSFEMGDHTGEGYYRERPVHTVKLDKFEMSAYEITQGQYKAIMGANPSHFSMDNLPVEKVSWYDAVTFCNSLSTNRGLETCYNLTTWECDFSKNGYRLPTEAEWEYACRAGTTTKYYSGDSESALSLVAYYKLNSNSKTHPAGQKEPNTWVLFDMHGNVWEWCNDWLDVDYYNTSPEFNPTGPKNGDNRIIRGGGWNGNTDNCRIAFRSYDLPEASSNTTGFRIVRGAFTPGYTISGTVSGADSITITLSGDASGSQTVNNGGSYSFTVVEGGNYTITLIKTGYTFTPASRTFNNVTSNQTQNFTANKVILERKIAFSSQRNGINEDIYIMNLDGSSQTRLTNQSGEDHHPSWSPDGSQIVFSSKYRDNSRPEIYIMNADGSNLTRLTYNNAFDSHPSWSPDGSLITFYSNREDDYIYNIYIMNADGSNQRNITNNTSEDRYPSWSPDGSQIAFVSDRDLNYEKREIYVMNVDGSNQTRLTNNSWDDFTPSWPPDGSQIAFDSKRDGNNEIYVMDGDGSNLTRLTNNLADDTQPSWSPFLL